VQGGNETVSIIVDLLGPLLPDEPLQDFGLFGDDFICDLLRQRQNALHPIIKARWHLVILVLFLQELNRQALLLLPIRQY